MNLVKVKIVLSLLLLLPAMIGFSQRVKVVNQNFEPLSKVNIVNTEHTKHITTDYRGKATVNEFDVKDTLVFSHKSYKPVRFTVAEIIDGDGWIIMQTSTKILAPVNIVTPMRDKQEQVNEPGLEKEVITTEKLEEINAQTTADALQRAEGVQVQKSQMGGGSPIVRGFEANRVLLVVDGVRMNNAIYRNGHLQNSVTIDNNVLSQIEINYGPSSVVYGSDAIGGVIHFHTKDPEFSEDGTTLVKGSVLGRYNSANQEKTAHVDVSLTNGKWGSLTSISANDFGDLRTGSVRAHGYEDFGKVFHYAQRIDGQDSMVVNSDPNLQRGTGYKQMDILQKVVYKASDKLTLRLNTQYSNSTDVPRFDRLNDYSGDNLKFAEWYYGPQQRILTALRADIADSNFFFSRASIIASYQNIQEDRISRRFGNTSKSYNLENVDVYALNADFARGIDSSRNLYYGIELTHNDVVSTAKTVDIETGEEGAEATRYPDGGSTMSSAAFYTNYVYSFKNFVANLGGRYSYTDLSATFINDAFVPLPFDQIIAKNGALSGSLGLVYQPNELFQTRVNFSTGFRSPNIDDFGKVFEKDDYVVIPNDQIEPEYAYNGEIGISKSFQRNYKTLTSRNNKMHLLTIGASGFYTLLNNAIVRSEFTLNGEDSLLVDGENLRVNANVNAEQAVVYGASGNFKLSFNKNLSVRSSINYTIGTITATKEPFAHIQPLFGSSSVVFEQPEWGVEFFADYNGWKRIEDYGGSTDNPQEATADGTPSWYTLNLKGHYSIGKYLTIQGGIYNILDHHYKPFSSGLSAPGRSFMLAVRAFF